MPVDPIIKYLGIVESAFSKLESGYIERYEEEILTPEHVNLRIRVRFPKGYILEWNEAVTAGKGHTAIIEKAPEGGFWAICPEVPGANGQGETVEEAKESLKKAISLIMVDRIEDIKRGLPDDAIQETISI
jgi:predicted RNase H-like HicB family nuclease